MAATAVTAATAAPTGATAATDLESAAKGGGGGGGGGGANTAAKKVGMADRMRQFVPCLPEKVPEVMPPRTIEMNDPDWAARERHLFASNKIFTAKYNFFTFLPKFLFEQFMRLANFYFLVISIIQMSSSYLAPTGQYYTFIPLMCILFLTACKELLEDYRRHRQDTETNNHLVNRVGRHAELDPIKWEDLRVGDIVRIKNGHHFPADLLLLASSEPEAICYVETSNLDGETNLKIRQGVSQTAKCQTLTKIHELRGSLTCEGPNNRLYNFDGTLRLGAEEIPIGPNQILLRGSMLRNASWIYGLVVYTGHESKLLRNASSAPIKKSRLERMVNYQILAIFGLLFTMATVCVIGFVIWNADQGAYMWYLDMPTFSSSANFAQWVIFVVLFNTVVPISLYVSVEFVKLIQAVYINSDLDMYYEPADAPALARTSNLNEELGQIDFVFSDKTGTLTRNQMQFRKCSVAGILYGTGYTEAYVAAAKREGRTLVDVEGAAASNEDDATWNFNDKARLLDRLVSKPVNNDLRNNPSFIREFLVLLAVCHTVIPERDATNPDRITYQASSPDELALVSAAKHLGFYFNVRKPDRIRIVAMSEPEWYEILNVLEFSSDRKRMSIICRTPQGKIKLYCKGADNVIYERLAPNQLFKAETEAHLEQLAAEGLRTLCLAMTQLDPDTYEAWNKMYKAASTTIVNRAAEMDRVADLIERNLFLLGATAIEDKLQDGVPATIDALLKADIRVWMLTGDKKETAINIGYSCSLLHDDMNVLQCDATSDAAIERWANEQLVATAESSAPLALVIDGKTLTYITNEQCRDRIMELALKCKACIACRVSPIQKAQMVTMVRKKKGVRTLAIGDGANDVTMIQTADVGVGITGFEGLQAARSSDYAIGQFRFLQKLLFVHGAWSYRRLAKVILFSFYKTLTLYLVTFYYSFDNGFSGQVPWDNLTNALWNVIFTFFPILLLGLFDQDVSAESLMKYPQLYKSGQRNDFFNIRVFFGWFFNAIYHSLIIYLLVGKVFFSDFILKTGDNMDHYSVGTIYYICILATITGKIALVTSYWAWPNHLAIWGSFAVYILVLIVCGFKLITFYADAVSLYEVFPTLFGNAQFYFTVIFVPTTCLLRDYVWKYYKRQERYQDYHIIQEIERLPTKTSERRRSDADDLDLIPADTIVFRVPTPSSSPGLPRPSDASAASGAPPQSSPNVPRASVAASAPAPPAVASGPVPALAVPAPSTAAGPTTARAIGSAAAPGRRPADSLSRMKSQRSGFAFSTAETDSNNRQQLTQAGLIALYDSETAKPDGS